MKLKNINLLLACTALLIQLSARGQDSAIYRLRLSVPLIDVPQNATLPYRYPSMNQALAFGNDFYELGYWGIDGLGDKLFKRKDKPYKGFRKLSNSVFKYAVGLGFSYYGSELPLPLGVWTHEEFHRSVLGIGKINSKNGNWIGSRWDGTVYGVSDSSLASLKKNDPGQLLYAYVAGVQSEILFNKETTVTDFYKRRSFHKNSFLLYNAYYVYNYFKFSTGSASDSVKVLAPPHENKNASERDFVGADLTAWAYDMFNPDSAFTARPLFPNGEGVNRRVGISDLSQPAKDFLNREKKLSLLNFVNPAIFFVNRVKVNSNFSFLFFMQYAPTHFGHDVAYFFPFQYKNYDVLAALHTYKNNTQTGYGLQAGLYNYKISRLLEADVELQAWNQPDSYFSSSQHFGGALDLKLKVGLKSGFSAFAAATGKTKGWQLGNPYLKENFSMRFGLNYNLLRK
jgi:hypothetical protein